ncbi:Platelet-activating factor acetylhydrolase [Seminavis robusta]|uniref:1-alkyl-2-acetylglycerophosphocholine esterase n=1 Tax=Seminavis robusta TaxID=568900 RepID=A0A9N8DNT1_9STRA|nr:Platelet-activating factor acetylhydrolase [Seminavis robusta]|eukprot:Sro265_g102820.1 Platelet-activating factor acetylhydrolase (372) ;mRNA; f:45155-46270
MLEILPNLDGLITGDAEAVGVRYIPPTRSHPPLRLFYPAKQPDTKQPCVRWFQDTPSAGMFLCGYLHVIGIKHGTWAFAILSRFLRLVAYCLPLQYRSLPDTYAGIDMVTTENNPTKLPIVVFSHGLTGTTQENSLLCAAWARQGYMVAAVHHADGSSACVPQADGSTLWYQHGPSYKNYDATFRPKQIDKRARDMNEAVDYLRQTYPDQCDFDKIVAAGFSYGAATAAFVAVQDDSPFQAGLILLDGWFYLDISESAGIEFEFPALAFERLDKIHSIPTIIINSAVFEGYPKLNKATNRLAGNVHERHIIPGTQHNNFCELCFWLPSSLMTFATILGGPVDIGAIGAGNPKEIYQDIIGRTSQFLREAFK